MKIRHCMAEDISAAHTLTKLCDDSDSHIFSKKNWYKKDLAIKPQYAELGRYPVASSHRDHGQGGRNRERDNLARGTDDTVRLYQHRARSDSPPSTA